MAVPLNVPVHCRLHIAPGCFLTPGMVIACPLSLNLIYYFLIAEKYFSVPGSQYKLEIQPSDQESQVISFLTPDHLRSFSWLVWHLSLWYLLQLGRSYENRLSKSARLKNKPWVHHLVMFDLEQTICSCNKSVFPGWTGQLVHHETLLAGGKCHETQGTNWPEKRKMLSHLGYLFEYSVTNYWLFYAFRLFECINWNQLWDKANRMNVFFVCRMLLKSYFLS